MQDTRTLSSDFIAGIVVFLIAVPLCLGIALASGAPLFSGMITGIVGGIIVGLLSKSQVSVCGPAAGLTAIVLDGISSVGAFEGFLVAVILAGLFQMVLGGLKAGTIGYYFPSNVIKGMLSAIGIIIILKQITHFVGYDEYPDGDLFFRQADGENSFSILLAAFRFIHPGVLITGVLSLSLMIIWDKWKPARFKLFPGALLAVIAGVLCNYIFQTWNLKGFIIEPKHLVSLPVAENLDSFLGQLTFPVFSYLGSSEVWMLAVTIAIVASIETLLTIEATDKIDPQKRVTPTNHELFAQGIGNMFCGFLGGLPLTSVIVRSSANINAGGRTKKATVFHGMFLLIGVLLLPRILNLIPLTSLAAILLVTGYKLASPAVFRKMFKEHRSQWIPYLVTIVAIVLTDLLTGVLIGMGVSLVGILAENVKNTYYFHREKYKDGDLIHIVLAQEVTFLNKAAISLTLDRLPHGSYVLLDATNSTFIDHDVLEIIKEFTEEKAGPRDIKVILKGFKEEYKLGNNDHIFFENVEDYPSLNLIKKGLNTKEAMDSLFKQAI